MTIVNESNIFIVVHYNITEEQFFSAYNLMPYSKG